MCNNPTLSYNAQGVRVQASCTHWHPSQAQVLKCLIASSMQRMRLLLALSLVPNSLTMTRLDCYSAGNVQCVDTCGVMKGSESQLSLEIDPELLADQSIGFGFIPVTASFSLSSNNMNFLYVVLKELPMLSFLHSRCLCWQGTEAYPDPRVLPGH